MATKPDKFKEWSDDQRWGYLRGLAAGRLEAYKEIEETLTIPCCHTSGMHDPVHFQERKYICSDQKAKAFESLCKGLHINPVTKSHSNCGWCQDYPEKRKGEGLRLFEEKK